NSNYSDFGIRVSVDGGDHWELLEDDLFDPIHSSNIYFSSDIYFEDDTYVDLYISTTDLGILKYRINLDDLSIADHEIIGNNSVTVFPNPAESMVHVNSEREITSIQIFDLGGKRLIS